MIRSEDFPAIAATYTDLAEERAEVVSMLLNLDALPAGMELFPATNDDAWTLIRRVIDESDYYLLVVGGRYGSVDGETNLSFTEKEFGYAVTQKKPVMAFLHGDPGKIPSERTDQNDEAREKLDAFRKKVEDKVHANYWSEKNELAGLVAKSLVKIQKSHPAIGWIRGDVETANSVLAEINELRKQLDAAHEQLAASKELPPPGTSHLSQGEDPFQLPLRGQVDVQYKGSPARSWERWTDYIAPTLSWDQLLAAVGPDLLDEIEHETLRENLDFWLTEKFRSDWAKHAREAIESEGKKIRASRGSTLAIGDDDFGTIIVQLRALGLIHRGERKRPVADNGTYWCLTPFGDTHLTTLRAIRRKSVSGSETPADGTSSEREEETLSHGAPPQLEP